MDFIVPKAPALARAPGGLAHVNPVGPLVTGAPEPVRFHEGFQQVKAMVVTALPVGIDSPGNLRQNMGGQVRHPHPRQDGHIRQEFYTWHAFSIRITRMPGVKLEY